ncbi:unnamed protein product [Penicillium salamii]|nr:unnamed protein product [Penicillium salamii]
MLPKKGPDQSNTTRWFHTILTAEPSHTDTIESTKKKGSRPGCAMPLLSNLRREET